MAKFCTNCGNSVEENQKMCLNCGSAIKNNSIEISRKDNHSSYSNSDENHAPKSKILAGILAIILGSFGVHNFYLGYKSKGFIQLAITIISCFNLSFITGAWALVEGIMILTGAIDKDAYGNTLIN